jgi:hypothetical protein
MPDFVRIACQGANFLRQTIVRVGQNKDFCHVEGAGKSAGPSGDVNSNAALPPDFSIEVRAGLALTARSTSRCAMFESR